MKRVKITRKTSTLLITVGLVLVVIFAGAIFFKNKSEPQPQNEPTITYSTDTPDESKSNAENYNWKGALNEPKKIKIKQISVDAFIQKAGVDQKNQVAVPNNVHLAGWYNQSQKPGQNGLSIIAGHVTGKTSDGVFKQLGVLKAGDMFEIELGNGEVKSYKVIETKQVKEAESAGVLFSQNPKVKSQVNLITCGGTFNKTTNQYDDRIIVSSELQVLSLHTD